VSVNFEELKKASSSRTHYSKKAVRRNGGKRRKLKAKLGKSCGEIL
jgi:hypothetical protein